MAMRSLENSLFLVKTKSGTLLRLACQILKAEMMAKKRKRLNYITSWCGKNSTAKVGLNPNCLLNLYSVLFGPALNGIGCKIWETKQGEKGEQEML